MKNKIIATAIVSFFAFTMSMVLPASAELAKDLPNNKQITTELNIAKSFPSDLSNTEEYRDYISSRVSLYLRVDENNRGFFDVEAAKENYESEDVIYVGKQVNAFAAQDMPSTLRSSEWEITKAGSGIFSGYRYCGYGNLGGNPTNVLDEGCRQHDNCYDRLGWGKCSCDSDFIAYINRNSSRMGWQEWAQAQGAKLYFSLPGCKK